MDKKRFAAEALALLVIAVLCATVANAVAARSRKVAWSADYPNALVVPAAAPAGAVTERQPLSAGPQLPPVVEATPLPTPVTQPSVEALLLPESAPTEAPAAATPAVPAPRATPTPAARAAKQFPPHPEKPWVEITGEDVADLYGRKVLFIDARRTDVYNEGHIAGARSMPVWEADVDARVAALYEEGRDQNAPVVVYCSGGNCEDSHMLAQKLWGAGFDNVLVYKDGFPDWQKRGGAVARGPGQ